MSEERTKPILPGSAGSDYERYLRTDDLLALQKTADQVVHRDEHLFQAVHQSSELWLKLACTELEQATTLVAADGVAAAVRLLRRASDCIALITTQLHMLEHMSPVDYAVGSQNISRHDQNWNGALAAAEAGIDDYIFRLGENGNYWQYNAGNLPTDGNKALTQYVPVAGSPTSSQFRYDVDASTIARWRRIFSLAAAT